MKKISGIVIVMALCLFAAREGRAWMLYGSLPNIPGAWDLLAGTIGKYQHQPKLAKGFANSSVFTSDVATHRGFIGYEKFAISVGTMAGAQAPASTTNLSYYKSLPNRLKKEGDIFAGVAWNAWSLSAGARIPGDVYLTGKFGLLKYTYGDYKFDGKHAGGMINYQVVKPKAPKVKIVMWRGISIGSGFIWQFNNTRLRLKLDALSYGGFAVKPELNLYIKTESYVIPLEISTAVRLIWVLNIHAGGGIDFAWGESRIRYKALGVVVPAGFLWAYGQQNGKGSSHYMPKIFCGPGLSFGPVFIDIPFTYYFNGGFNLGVTLGVAI